MFKPYENINSIYVKEMQVIVYLSRGMTQGQAAELSGLHQPRVNKIVGKIEHIYGIEMTEGSKSNYRLTKDGLALACQFEKVIEIMSGSIEDVREKNEIIALKVMAREMSDIAERLSL